MAYRKRQEDPQWQVARVRFDEQELPEQYRQALDAFEREMRKRQPAKAPRIELESGSDVETYYPTYDAMKLEGMVSAVLLALGMWVFGGLLISVIGVMGLFFLPDPLVLPVMILFLALGFGGVGAFALRMVLDTWRHNRAKRAASGPIAYGTFLLADAIIVRHPSGTEFYPRDCVVEVEIERTAAASGGGYGTASFSQSAESFVCFRYVDASSELKLARFIGKAFPGHEPEPAERLGAWIGQTSPADEREGFGAVVAADLGREDYARGWRSFRRRRRAALISLTAPGLLFISVAIAGHAAGSDRLDQLLGDSIWPVILLFFGPGLVGWALYRAARCPRCRKWPRQPLAGTKVTQCLSCGLPIFTEVTKPAATGKAKS